MSILTIHIGESGTTFNKEQRTAIIGALIVPYNHRKEVKEEVKNAILSVGVSPDNMVLQWRKVSPSGEKIYKNVLTELNNDELVLFRSLRINNFSTRKLIPAYLYLIKKIQDEFPEDKIRVFVKATPEAKVSKLTMLQDAANSFGLDIEFFQSPIDESRFLQCADFICGAILFYTRDDMYLEKIGMSGKAAIVEHGLSLRKKQNKFKLEVFPK